MILHRRYQNWSLSFEDMKIVISLKAHASTRPVRAPAHGTPQIRYRAITDQSQHIQTWVAFVALYFEMNQGIIS